MKAGKSVAFATIADIVTTTVREHLRFLARASLLVVDEIGYLPVAPGGGNLFFQLEDARYDKSAMILNSNWPQQCLMDCFPTQLYHIEGSSYRLRQHAALVPENVRSPTRRSPSAAAARLEGPMT
ncbi:ATP-binding protein [Bradyrhizobium sp. 151]|uniref:ATP-binding protein n=1 Tax=Bradyrhizobium sp. 151 TaxID=2782626 RepID=UPI00320B148D